MAVPEWNENSKSYLVRSKPDPKDRVWVEVGDSKDPSQFFPQAKIGRWGDADGESEANVSFRMVDWIPGSQITHDEENGLIQWKKKWQGKDWIAKFYEDWGTPEGAYKFVELVLPARPPVDEINFSVVNKDVDFFYQPPLTQQEIDEGAVRPEEVVGSYAIYSKSKGGVNDSHGKDYKVGKIGHLYRAKIIDANGNETWGEYNTDLNETGILTLSVDPTWLDNAVYPVIVDPEFGYTSIGGTVLGQEEDVYGTLFTLSEDGDITQITSYNNTIESESGEDSYLGHAIYDSSKNLLANSSGALTITNDQTDWFSNNVSYSASSANFYLAQWLDSESGLTTDRPRMYYDSGDTGQTQVSFTVGDPRTDSWPDPLGSSDQDRKFSIYATYTASGGTETADVAPVATTFTVPAVTATYESEQTASVSPVATTFTAVAIAALATFSASVSPVATTYTVPSTTATYNSVQSASISPVSVTYTVPAVTATSEGGGGGGEFTLDDLTSNNNDLTNDGAEEETTIVPSGLSGANNSLKFVASESDAVFITDANQTGLDGLANLTFETWLHLASGLATGERNAIIGKVKPGTNDVSYLWQLEDNSGTEELALYASTNGGFNQFAKVNWSPSAGTWYHLAVTYDGSAGEIKFYVNGSQQGTTQSVAGGTTFDGDANFALGINRHGNSPNSPLDGYLKDVRVWNTTRTQTEIDNNKGSFLGGDETGLVGYWPFETFGAGGGTETATLAPVSVTYTVPATTATYNAVVEASVAPVSTTFTVPAVTATHQGVHEASVAPQSVTFTVPATTATYQAVVEASVAPVTTTFTIPSTTATSEGVYEASVAPVSTTFTVPTTTATYDQENTASVAPVSTTFTTPAVTGTYNAVSEASVAPVSVSYSVPGVTATFHADAQVSPVNVTFTVPSVTATGGAENTHSLDLEADSSQYASIADANQTGLDLSGDFTFEQWLKPETLSDHQVIHQKGQESEGTLAWRIQFNASGDLAVQVWQDGTPTRDTISWSGVISNGVWSHIAITFDVSEPSATQFELFKDRVSQGNGTTGVTDNISSIQNNSEPFVLGADKNSDSFRRFFDGKMNNVRIWNDVRTPTEISNNWKKVLTNTGVDNLVDSWYYDDTHDSASGNNNLTATNSPVFSTDIPFPEEVTASLSPVSTTFTIPATTATYVQVNTASVAPISTTFTVPSVTAQNVATASVSPVAITYTVIVPSPSVTTTWTPIDKIDDTGNWTSKMKADESGDWTSKSKTDESGDWTLKSKTDS